MEASRQRFRSQRTSRFTESVIREMTRLALRHNAVNLAQGFPDFSAPAELKQAASPYPIFRIMLCWNQSPFQDHPVLDNSALWVRKRPC